MTEQKNAIPAPPPRLLRGTFVAPFGDIHVVTEPGPSPAVVRVSLPSGGRSDPLPPASPAPPDDPLHAEVRRQLAEWFAGRRREFDLPLRPAGTPFRRAVWDALRRIPWGRTRTYGEVAAAVGRPGAARAVGGACGRNPLPLLVPCHRVLAAGGGLGGWSGDPHVKVTLLAHEGVGRVGDGPAASRRGPARSLVDSR